MDCLVASLTTTQYMIEVRLTTAELVQNYIEKL
jgi:hypothetical protein